MTGESSLDTQLGKLGNSLENIEFFCKPCAFDGVEIQQVSYPHANRKTRQTTQGGSLRQCNRGMGTEAHSAVNLWPA